jgi:hypothetical protein
LPRSVSTKAVPDVVPTCTPFRNTRYPATPTLSELSDQDNATFFPLAIAARRAPGGVGGSASGLGVGVGVGVGVGGGVDVGDAVGSGDGSEVGAGGGVPEGVGVLDGPNSIRTMAALDETDVVVTDTP